VAWFHRQTLEPKPAVSPEPSRRSSPTGDAAEQPHGEATRAGATVHRGRVHAYAFVWIRLTPTDRNSKPDVRSLQPAAAPGPPAGAMETSLRFNSVDKRLNLFAKENFVSDDNVVLTLNGELCTRTGAVRGKVRLPPAGTGTHVERDSGETQRRMELSGSPPAGDEVPPSWRLELNPRPRGEVAESDRRDRVEPPARQGGVERPLGGGWRVR
jgi:hypothetical protein